LQQQANDTQNDQHLDEADPLAARRFHGSRPQMKAISCKLSAIAEQLMVNS
jgi:hypothetical protein